MNAPQTYRVFLKRTGETKDVGGAGSLAIAIWARYKEAGLDPVLLGPGVSESCLLTDRQGGCDCGTAKRNQK